MMPDRDISARRNMRQEALDTIRKHTDLSPDYLLILGTGLSQLADEMDVDVQIPYEAIPHFPAATVENHDGKLLFGTLGGKQVVAMQGRFHHYEGYSMNQIVFPIRVLKMIGVDSLIVSNACGGMKPGFKKGDIMLIDDHINMMPGNPLTGPNDLELGPRFPDMSQPYTQRLVELAEQVALDEGIRLHKGVYVAVPGPMLETRAEYRYLRQIGADVVGMSTVPEVISAVHMGMDVLGISVITDECFPDALKPVSVEDILQAAGEAEPKMSRIITGVLQRL